MQFALQRSTYGCRYLLADLLAFAFSQIFLAHFRVDAFRHSGKLTPKGADVGATRIPTAALPGVTLLLTDNKYTTNYLQRPKIDYELRKATLI